MCLTKKLLDELSKDLDGREKFDILIEGIVNDALAGDLQCRKLIVGALLDLNRHETYEDLREKLLEVEERTRQQVKSRR